MPPSSTRTARNCLFLAAAFSLAVHTARAADAAPGAAPDALLLDNQSTATSQVLIALDRPTTPIVSTSVAEPAPRAVDTSADTGFDPAAVDPAVARPGDILQTGTASWYGGKRWAGHRTASGARFNPEAMTAASHTLPLGTRVLVTLEGTARSVLVTITDHQGTAQRVIDLSKAAARKLGLLGRGTGRVVLTRA